MAGWFGRKREVRPTIDSLSFDTSAWKYHGEQQPNRMRLWETPEHDAVVLHFYGIPPDIPPVGTVDELSALYAEGLKASGAKVVECGLALLAGHQSIRLLIKVPRKPSGMMYQGVLTLPFRDFSFVVKIQCQETGMTGIREAILLDRRLKAGETPRIDGTGPLFPDWNPDAAEHDEAFPKHPVSRLRRLLKHVMGTADLEATVRECAGFPLPAG